MTTKQASNFQTIGISISESPDLAFFGLSEGHLNDAMVSIATHLLAAGDHLAYGGDLRPGGFTETLFELVNRYTPATVAGIPTQTTEAMGAKANRVANYLAWPVHASWDSDILETRVVAVQGFADTVILDIAGQPMPMGEHKQIESDELTDTVWSNGLTRMRETMRGNIDARVLLGGKTQGYRGWMPGVAEEALLSLKKQQPIFLLGGFGGATRDVAEVLSLAQPWQGSRKQWPGHSEFGDFGPESLHNTLSLAENRILATTPHIDRSLPLLLRGLSKLRNRNFSATENLWPEKGTTFSYPTSTRTMRSSPT